MKNSIAFYEQIQKTGERNAFQEIIQSLNIPLFHRWNDLSTSIPTILFFHGGNEPELCNKTDFGSNLKPQLSNTWLIEFGGYNTNKINRSENIVSYINFAELQGRLSTIIEKIYVLPEITKEKLEEIIFNYDPKLEELLTPFASYHPFYDSAKDLKLEKAILQNYINSNPFQ